MLTVETSELPLEKLYQWEKETGNATYMTQPMGGDAVKKYTWAQTAQEARRMARYLKDLGYEPGSTIAILSKNCAEFVITEIAIWMAGYKTVAIYPTLTAAEVSYILEHSEAKLLFVGKLDEWDEMKPGVPEDMPKIAYTLAPPNDYDQWGDIIAKTEPIDGSPVREATDIALLVYTSGSTGKPKGVMHDFKNLSTALKGFNQQIDITQSDRFLSYLPLAHVFERAIVECGSLLCGCQVFFAESLDTFVDDLQRAQPTIFHSVPRLWMKFQQKVSAQMPEEKLKKLLRIPILSGIVKKKILTKLGLDQTRIALSGSAPIPKELIQWYRDLGLELLEGYGMSENFCYSHFTHPGDAKSGYVGKKGFAVEDRISEEGEILVKSPANMIGYYKNEEATKDAFTEDGFLKTGDRGELDEAGRLRITGRVKELFKTSKGKYVAPAPIENLICAEGLAEAACVTGSGEPSPYGLLMLNEDLRARRNDPKLQDELNPQLEALLKEVNSNVAHHEQLAFLVVVKDEWTIADGFLTPTMKIKRNILEDVYTPKQEEWYGARQKVIWE